jgi:glucose-1-phosphate thymidylyltransferase
VRAVVLAAGYATRLRPLTNEVAKPLLPLAGRPLIDYLCDKIAAVDEVDSIHVVTNARFADAFGRWAAGRAGPPPLTVHDDGTATNEDRLGAIGDVRFVVREAGLAGEDLLVLAGDNLFDFELRDFVRFWHDKGEASCIGVYDCGDLRLAAAYGVIEIDESTRVTSLVEKPAQPASTLVATATYVFCAEHAGLVERYLAEGNSPDQPGRFVEWLYTRVPVYGYRFAGEWLDIGDRSQLLQAHNRLRVRAGLPPEHEYTLSPQS